jgi:hypothetical protein
LQAVCNPASTHAAAGAAAVSTGALAWNAKMIRGRAVKKLQEGLKAATGAQL